MFEGVIIIPTEKQRGDNILITAKLQPSEKNLLGGLNIAVNGEYFM